jgi:C4-dicarboxylate-specific signal transduction histidine kinase
MFTFDLHTAFLILGLFYLLLPAFTWVVLAGQRSTQVALWCSGGLMMGTASMLTSVADQVTGWVGIAAAGLLFTMSCVTRIQSLRLDLGTPWRWRWIVTSVLAIFLILIGLHFGLKSPLLRAQTFSLVMASLMAHLAALAWRIGKDEESNSARWIAGIYAIVALALLIRVFLLMRADTIVMVREGLSAQILAVSMLFSAVIGHLGYIGLQLDRAMRREFKIEAERVRKEERHHLGEQIAQLDRSRALGEMAASLGHELNQPLTATLTSAQVAKRGMQSGRFDTGQVTELIDKIIYNTKRASQIIERIREYIRPSQTSRMPVDLNLVMLEVKELIANDARIQQAHIEVLTSPLPALVTGDAIQLSQIVLNMVRNAIEAISHVALRKIHLRCNHVGNCVVLHICDTGPGLTAEALSHIGTPFFSTKATGLGMGFSISRSIAIQHGGTLTITNANGGGAIAELILPALPLPAPASS